MTYLSDGALARVRAVADLPDLSGTRYEALEPIGRGGMGTVWRARDGELDREVAIKVTESPELAPETVARLRTEARALARLEHPGIVPVHDVGVLPDGRLFYVMRLVRGRRLDEHARAERSQPALLRLFERVCEAVAFAHARGVLHRDLKPENVMVGPFGEVLVLDWGIARLRSSAERPQPVWDGGAPAPEERVTSHGTVLGTPGYMSPEQSRGEHDAVDERADVYSLGGLLYFLLTGRPPGQPPEPPRRVEPKVPRPLAAICLKALAAAPADRYAGASELRAEVGRFLEGLPVQAYREGPLERARRLAWKYRTPLALIVAYLVMRVLLAVLVKV